MRLAVFRHDDSALITNTLVVDGDEIPDRLEFNRVEVEIEQSVIGEPLIWSHITDGLPAGHPLAWTTVYCKTCGGMVHASNNECMDTWVETGQGAYCLIHFVEAVKDVKGNGTYYVLEDSWALKRTASVTAPG